jgi:hypothetical protein
MEESYWILLAQRVDPMINQQVAYYGSSDANYVIQLSTSL